jgi:EAL domain-containing protein (putative c-di-GMP-specific phosphodiesterase class I)
LYQKLHMVVDDVEVELKNKIIESIHYWWIKLWGQEIKTIHQEETMELLCRIIDKNTWDELDEIWPNKVKVPIFIQLDIAKRLWYRSIITNFNIQSAFLISQKYPTKKLSLNMSYDDILDEAVIECFLKLWEQYPDAKRNITIELLENEIIDKRQYITQLRKLDNAWYDLAIDDFWSEYNNFSILTLLVENDIPIAKIKIDRVVIQKLQDLEWKENDPDYWKKLKLHKWAITTIKSVLEIAQDYGIPHVVAEYVENRFIYDQLAALWVHEFQWYYFAKPEKINY